VTNVPVITGPLALRPGAPPVVCWPLIGRRTGSLSDAAKRTPVNALDLSRWQFGITTVYHFIFVPLTIGLSIVVAVMQTVWLVKKDPAWLRMTKFFGSLFLINFAVGVVTGIVQEFQFGMNWSAYSRFVGDVFGAPLAMEALLAFFLESTFIGLWIFGWGKLPPRLHLATIWIAAIGTNLSASLAARGHPAPRSTSPSRRVPAAAAGSAPCTPWCRRCSASSGPGSWSASTAATPTGATRWAAWRSPSTPSGPRTPRSTPWLTRPPAAAGC